VLPGALPRINLITGVVASGLSTDDSASLDRRVPDAVLRCGGSRVF
jgi:hypothetical protein